MTGKFSILMPSYNDENYILETINSVVSQTYNNWEIILIDDGSTDSSREIIKRLNNPNITYLYQENADQLNALKNGSRYITGDYVLLLHSDDLLESTETLKYLAEEFIKQPFVDGFYSDFITINADSTITGVLKSTNYNKKKIFKEVFWQRGDNNLGDPFVIRKAAFFKWVFPNYIENNTIYYIGENMPNLKRVKSWYKYRVFSENYINSDVGKFVVFNGTQRTIFRNYNNYSFTFYNILYISIVNKLISKFKISKLIKLQKNEDYNWDFLTVYYRFWRSKLVKQMYPELALRQIDKILDSIEKRKNEKAVKVLKIHYSGEKLYTGADARIFYQDYINGRVTGLYKQILEEEYDLLVVKDQESANAVNQALVFYGLYYEVKYESNLTKKHI